VVIVRIGGFCPMGCGPELGLEVALDHGRIECQNPLCPRPTAAQEILCQEHPDHIVHLSRNGWSITHPAKERLDDELSRCGLNVWLNRWRELPYGPGRYRVQVDADRNWDQAYWQELRS
jgi:hypothetical protein